MDAGGAALDEHRGPLTGSQHDLIDGDQLGQGDAVGADPIQLVAVKSQVVEGVGAGVENAPALRLPGPDGDDGVALSVDPVLWAIGAPERPLQDEQPLRPTGEARQVVELALDDDGSRQSGLNLIAGIAVDMGVIPVEPG